MSKNDKNKKIKKHNNTTINTSSALQGVLDISRTGLGFVAVEGLTVDIVIRPGSFNTALHGDSVSVAIENQAHRSQSSRTYGKILKVLLRKQTKFIGTIHIDKFNGMFIADTDKQMPNIFVAQEDLLQAKDGQRVVCKITNWSENKRQPDGEIIEVLADLSHSDVAMRQIIYERGFALQFNDDTIEEAERIPEHISEAEIKKRKDFRNVFTITIDPADAKDFDDAISLQKISEDLYEVGVHIADVSHYVTPGTALDDEAYQRATSVYLPGSVNSMLPERISNELCSLRPHEDKLTFSAVFNITTKGEIKDTWIGRTAIHSNHRYAYEDVQAIIEGANHEFAAQVHMLNNISKIFRAARFAKGAINFSSIETKFKLDENGKPIEVIIKESKESHQLIEELMLLANKAVAEKVGKILVKDKPLPFPYRIHDVPDEDKLAQFMVFAGKFGYKFDIHSPKGISESFNQMLAAAKGTPEQNVLEQLGIRTMAKAIYATDNIGHYGLGFDSYCHFTSPIRRYPDVLVHRILQQIIDNHIVVDKKMNEKCKHTSERERAAMEAERAANKYKQVEFMMQYIGETFEGVISGVASFGLFVETIAHKCEGLISMSSLLLEDDYRFDQADYCLKGTRKGKVYRIGDKLQITIINASLEKRQLDFELATATDLWTDTSKINVPKKANTTIQTALKNKQQSKQQINMDTPKTKIVVKLKTPTEKSKIKAKVIKKDAPPTGNNLKIKIKPKKNISAKKPKPQKD